MPHPLDRRSLMRTAAAASATAAVGTGLGALSSPAAAATARDTASAHDAVTIGKDPYKVAVVTAAPVEFDLRAGVDKAVTLIQEAAHNGARLIAFGELWLPGYPKDVNYDPNWLATGLPAYARQSLTVGGKEWQRLREAARKHRITVEICYSERAGKHLFMGQALFGPDGEPLIVRREIRPSGSERTVFSDDDLGRNIDVRTTELGRIGALSCWEHLHPEMTYNMLAQLEAVHIAAWPYNSPPGSAVQWWEDVDVALSAARVHAINGGCYVLLPSAGYGAVLNPRGQLLVTSVTGKEDLLYATVDPSAFTTKTADPEGETSYGVLRLLARTYPGPRVSDPEHERKNMVTVPLG
ncbi:nitrilase-related carbon-nitrogen hydrolase [Streptomyces sp. NPDC051554]|uniref:nitrilase-related carbon-nitrogen hydrolase n=1 Tax=Streptomyces sp. NPDC051554 TaxID=3365656 RepID=UPI0037A6C0C5